jgi:hypothetical protein
MTINFPYDRTHCETVVALFSAGKKEETSLVSAMSSVAYKVNPAPSLSPNWTKQSAMESDSCINQQKRTFWGLNVGEGLEERFLYVDLSEMVVAVRTDQIWSMWHHPKMCGQRLPFWVHKRPVLKMVSPSTAFHNDLYIK